MQRHRPCVLTKSTRVNSPLPSRSACATRHTSNSWPHNRAWSAGGSHPTRIICVLRSRGQSVSRSAMNSPFRFAAGIIGSFIKLAMRLRGGKLSKSTRSKPPSSFGNKQPFHRHPLDRSLKRTARTVETNDRLGCGDNTLFIADICRLFALSKLTIRKLGIFQPAQGSQINA